LAPLSACYFTATNNMKNYMRDGKSMEYLMSVGFMLQNEYDTKILVDNPVAMYPAAWTKGATTDNWLHYTRINPANNAMKNIE